MVKSIKRGAELILSKNGIIRSFENLGFRNLPYKMKANDGHHTQGKYVGNKATQFLVHDFFKGSISIKLFADKI